MAEAFKNNFSVQGVAHLARLIARPLPKFDQQSFVDYVANDFENLELKQRSSRITEALHQFLPNDLDACKQVIEAILHGEAIEDFANTHADDEGLRGWMIMPVADFVSLRWLEPDFLGGLELLKKLTPLFSAEFAIRDFILAQPDLAIAHISGWLQDDSEHVRRLCSEGLRPRLPWGKQLGFLVRDPSPLKTILLALQDDPSEYVRRSVANNLNDIAKDHADFVIDYVSSGIDTANHERQWLYRHACRSLIKQGDKQTLALFDYHPFEGDVELVHCDQQVPWNGTLSFAIKIDSERSKAQNLMIDYVLWHQKANGTMQPKVFKWRKLEGYEGAMLSLDKAHTFKPVTTRKYYPGEHKVEIQINGVVVANASFELKAPQS